MMSETRSKRPVDAAGSDGKLFAIAPELPTAPWKTPGVFHSDAQALRLLLYKLDNRVVICYNKNGA